MDKYKRILIFNVNWVGDVLFSTATIRNIRRNYPDSFIACVVPSRCYQVLKGNPHLDEVIVYDDHDRHKQLMEKLKFIQLLKEKKFEAVFLLHRSFSRALLCRLAGIPERIGYYTKKRSFILTKNIKPPDIHSLHRIDYYLSLIEKAGLKVEDRYPELVVDEQDKEFVEGFLKNEGFKNDDRIAAVNPGGNWLPKRWPLAYWAELCDRLIAESGYWVIITGGLTDHKLIEEIKGLMKNNPVIAAGKLNLKQLAALSKRLDLFITADTGPLHIANAAGAKRIIALFGPTSAFLTGPFPLKNIKILQKNVGCKIPCYVVKCADNRCMKAITVADVIKEINS